MAVCISFWILNHISLKIGNKIYLQERGGVVNALDSRPSSSEKIAGSIPAAPIFMTEKTLSIIFPKKKYCRRGLNPRPFG